MRIAFFELEEWAKEAVQRELSEHELLLFTEPLSERHLTQIQEVEALAVFIYSRISKEVLDRLPHLRLLATMSTGYDHIDVQACKVRNIVVCNVPTYGKNTVAEHTMALILALSRKLYPSVRRTHEQHRFETDKALRGFDLKGKTLGLVGCGHIGKHVARMALGFEMRVIALDHHIDESLARADRFAYAELEQVFREADIISLHLPYSKSTHHLINEETIAKMKHGVHIINTARGGLIDTHALVKALQTGKVAGAALDVLEGECEVKEEAAVLTDQFKASCDLRTMLEDHLLMKMENVIITPHNAFNSSEALMRILTTTNENIKEFLRGQARNVL